MQISLIMLLETKQNKGFHNGGQSHNVAGNKTNVAIMQASLTMLLETKVAMQQVRLRLLLKTPPRTSLARHAGLPSVNTQN